MTSLEFYCSLLGIVGCIVLLYMLFVHVFVESLGGLAYVPARSDYGLAQAHVADD